MEIKVDDGHVERKRDVGCLIVWPRGRWMLVASYLHGRRATWMKEWIVGRLMVGATNADVGCLVGTTILLASILNSQSASHDSFGNSNKNQFYC